MPESSKPTLLPMVGDCDTGFGYSGSDKLTLVVGGVDYATIKMDERDGDSHKSSGGVHGLGTYHDYVGAVSWSGGDRDSSIRDDYLIDAVFGLKIIRPEKAVRLD